jgi:hypothetical protein
MKPKSIHEATASTLYHQACCFVLFFMAAAASFHGYYDKWHFMDDDLKPATITKYDFKAMMDGTAQRPYVYRQLLPAVANWIDAQIPATTKDRLFSMHDGKPFGYGIIDGQLAKDRAWYLRYLIFYAEEFLFTLLAVYAGYWLVRAANIAPAPAVISTLAFTLAMPYFAEYYYDYPELAFLLMAVAIAIKSDWWWIIPIAALATWTKESFLLFIPALYPFLRQRHSRSKAAALTAALAATSAAVYFVLHQRYQHNPGGTVELHYLDQFQFLIHPLNLITAREGTYRVLHPAPFTILPIALIIATVWRGWRYLSPAIQRHTQIAAVINIPLFLIFCWPGELRDLSLLYPAFLLLIAVNLTQWTKLREKI